MNTLTRRDVLRTGLAAAALGVGSKWLVPGPAYGATSPFVAYSADSYFKKPVTSLPVDATRTTAFRSFMASHPNQRSIPYPRINGTAGNSWGTSYAMATSADPIWKLTGTIPTAAASLRTTGFHAPDWLGTVLTGTTDSPFCVIDQGSGFTVMGTKASVVGPRTISVSSAGLTYHSSNGLHGKNPLSNDKRNFTGRGRISDAMVIRRDLVSYGVANNTDLGHVLHLFLCETRTSDGFCNPMVGPEGGKYGFGAEGERIAIAASVDVTRRGLSPEALVVARTLQNHGCYIGDNAGGGSALKAEQETSARPVWRGALGRDSLAGIKWDDFVVIRRGM